MNFQFPLTNRPRARFSVSLRRAVKILAVFAGLWLPLLGGYAEDTAAPKPPKASDFAGIYSMMRGAPEKTAVESFAPGAKVTENKQGEKSTFVCEWPDVTVKIFIDPKWDLKSQIDQMKKLLNAGAGKDKDSPVLTSLMKSLDETVDCYGCVITPHYDTGGKAAALVLKLAANCRGFVYSHTTFYDSEGRKIAGFEDDPMMLQDSK